MNVQTKKCLKVYLKTYKGDKMNKITYFVLLIIIYSSLILEAQPRRDDDPPPPIPFKKLQQFEKAKLIEILDMDENTSIKFFARRNESMNRFMKLATQRDALIDEIEAKLNKEKGEDLDKFYKHSIERLMEIENKMLDERKSFINTLDDILTKEQIMKFVIFDFRLKREIKDRIKEKK
ncbi:MAG TPA: hypothetical protein PL041_04600 [Melioribacteraceae bacterium]|nr:hypothetical protein [Melioribacteraceae bacterium]